MIESRPTRRRTFSRLQTGRRIPTEYELVSSDLHYNYPQKFELGPGNPVADWYYRHREGSPLQAADWGVFADPRATTYRSYNELQDGKETVVDGLLREIDATGYDDHLGEGWVSFLQHWYAPLRFPAHALIMLAAYIGQMAPDSRITNCASFQAADEMRRLQRVAYRTAQLHAHRGGRNPTEDVCMWEEVEAFQPLRELVERALVAYDWGEAFVVTNVLVKPHFDRLVNVELAGALAEANGDTLLRDIHFSLDEDARWHRAWTRSLIQHSLSERPDNAVVVAGWIDSWRPLASEAVGALARVMSTAPVPRDGTGVQEQVMASVSDDIAVLLEAPGAAP